MKKLKSEVKRLRQELVMKPKKRGGDEDESFTDEEQQALQMISHEQRKVLIELDQAGCSRDYIKRKLAEFITNQDTGFM